MIEGSTECDAADTWTGRDVKVDRQGGRKASDKYVTYKDSIYAPLFRWREAFQNDFAARMDWSATSDFDKANHNPIAAVGDDKRTRT